MKLDFRNNKDFWAGATFFATGAAAITAAWNYPFGTAWRMGPGYFPVVLGGIMLLFGLILMIKGVHQAEKTRQIPGNWSVRALIVLPCALVLFGVLMKVAGFIPALVALIFVSAASGREFKASEVVLLTVVLVTISWGMFIWGLGLPYPLFIKFW